MESATIFPQLLPSITMQMVPEHLILLQTLNDNLRKSNELLLKKQINLWYDTQQIAEHFGVSAKTINQWVKTESMPISMIGEIRRFNPVDCDEWFGKRNPNKISIGTAKEVSKRKSY